MEDVRVSLDTCDIEVVNKLNKDEDEAKADSTHLAKNIKELRASVKSTSGASSSSARPSARVLRKASETFVYGEHMPAQTMQAHLPDPNLFKIVMDSFNGRWQVCYTPARQNLSKSWGFRPEHECALTCLSGGGSCGRLSLGSNTHFNPLVRYRIC